MIPFSDLTNIQANQDGKLKAEEEKEVEDYLSGNFTIKYDNQQINTAKKFMKKVNENPKDIKNWLEYVHA